MATVTKPLLNVDISSYYPASKSFDLTWLGALESATLTGRIDLQGYCEYGCGGRLCVRLNDHEVWDSWVSGSIAHALFTDVDALFYLNNGANILAVTFENIYGTPIISRWAVQASLTADGEFPGPPPTDWSKYLPVIVGGILVVSVVGMLAKKRKRR